MGGEGRGGEGREGRGRKREGRGGRGREGRGRSGDGKRRKARGKEGGEHRKGGPPPQLPMTSVVTTVGRMSLNAGDVFQLLYWPTDVMQSHQRQRVSRSNGRLQRRQSA
jgi:hypothetical protein